MAQNPLTFDDPTKQSTGLIGSAINPTKPLESVGGYDANTRTLDPSTQTVEGRFTNIMSSGNPLLTQARTRTASDAAGRGLLNSSMAVQAGEMSAMNAALPIAQQDAGFANDVANRNMDATNTALQFGANARNTASGAILGGQIQTGLIGTQTEAQKQLQAQQGDIQQQLLTAEGAQKQALQAQAGDIAQQQARLQAELQAGLMNTQAKLDAAATAQKIRGELANTQLSNDNRLMLAQIDANLKQVMQTTDSAARVSAEQFAAMAEVLKDPNTTADQKNQAMSLFNQQMQNYLTVSGGINNMNIAGLLDFSGSTPRPATNTQPTPTPTSSPVADVQATRDQILASGGHGQDVANAMASQGVDINTVAAAYGMTPQQLADAAAAEGTDISKIPGADKYFLG